MGSSINLRCTERMPREAELDSVNEERQLGREFSTADTQKSKEETTAGWSSSESTSDWLQCLIDNLLCSARDSLSAHFDLIEYIYTSSANNRPRGEVRELLRYVLQTIADGSTTYAEYLLQNSLQN